MVPAARNAAALQPVARHCRALGVDVLVVPTDVTDASKVAELASAAAAFGRIDVSVSNAGVGAVGKFQETPIEAHQQIISTNLVGQINEAHAAVPIFLKQGHRIFVNMISLGGFAAAPYASAYSASKFGLKGFSEALRAELSDRSTFTSATSTLRSSIRPASATEEITPARSFRPLLPSLTHVRSRMRSCVSASVPWPPQPSARRPIW